MLIDQHRSINRRELIIMKMALAAAAIITATLTAGHAGSNALEGVATDALTLQSSQGALPACKTDEAETNFTCIWNAKQMGNGEGRSFMLINRNGKDDRLIRISHRLANRLH